MSAKLKVDERRCPECGCKEPGRKLNCKSDNERALRYQRTLRTRFNPRLSRKLWRVERNARRVVVTFFGDMHDVPVTLTPRQAEQLSRELVA